MNRLPLILLTLGVLLLWATITLAVLVPLQITNSEADCSYPALASSIDELTVLAYLICGDPIPENFVQVVTMNSYLTDYIWWTDPVILNTGGPPSLCWSRTGFHCAFASGPVILVYHTLGSGEWDLEDYAIIETNGPVLGIDLYGVPTDAAGPDVFMAVHTATDPYDGDHHVMYASHNQSNGWSELTWVATETEMATHPQITWDLGPAGPLPKIFYLGGEPGDPLMKHTTYHFETGWTPPTIVPGDGVSAPSPFAGEFDVITRGFLERNILGLGPQPTCPCGTIHHQAYVPGLGWEASESMTSHYGEYDWPKSPNLATDPDGRVHAFWYQVSSASNLEPWLKTREYWVLEDGIWTDKGDFLYEAGNGRNFGEQVALAVDPTPFPVLAWTERDTFGGVPQPSQVIVAREAFWGDAPDPEIVQPKLKLSAWPNPFNPVVKLAFDTNRTDAVQLDVFDVRGRKVANLMDMVVGSGRTEVSWDGKNDAEHSLPSGVYFARLVSGMETAFVKLVLAQ